MKDIPPVGRRFARILLAAMKRRRKAKSRCGQRSAFLFESLEPRVLLAADLGQDHDLLDPVPAEVWVAPALAAEGEGSVDSAEGEAAQDLVAFAQALTDSGTRFFGAAWCPHCKDQKELFGDGADFLPYIEVTNLDSPVTLNAVGRGEDTTLNPSGQPVESFPTWEFPDGTRLTGTQTLETLSQRSGMVIPSSDQPFIAPVDDHDLDPTDVDADGNDIVQVLGGSPVHVALDGYDPGGGPLSFTVSSSDPGLVSATLLQGNRSMQIDVAGWGKMLFQLFEQRAPRPTSRLVELAEADFYDNITFHRIVNGFVIQAGDPTGTGSGGSPLGDFDDQFHEELQHNRTGTLSYAKSSDDTNDSQFFITEGATRHLDGNHSVAGVLVEGDKNREAISNNSTTNPRTAVIDSVDIFTDAENAVVMLSAAEGASGEADITVTATDAGGNQFSRVFHVTVQPDTSNTLPWLDDIGDLTVAVGTTLDTNFTARDIEGDPIQFGVVPPVNFTVGVPTDPVTPQSPATANITVTPDANFIGQEEVTFFAYDPTQVDLEGVDVTTALLSSNSSLFDVQTITVESEGSPVPPPDAIDLASQTDSSDDTDNITNFDNSTPNLAPQIVVTAADGALVNLFLDGVLIDQQQAASDVTFVLDGVTPLEQGIRTFSASQEIDGVRGPEITLDVTIDSSTPEFLSTAPTSTLTGSPFSYDARSREEGNAGHTYALLDPFGDPVVDGPVINPLTGVVAWDVPERGHHQFVIQAEDVAGNTASQSLSLTVADASVVQFRLEAIRDSDVVTVLNIGDVFTLNAYVQDIRGLPEGQGGPFSAYFDVVYNEFLATPVGDLQVNQQVFPSVNFGDTSTPGLIDGAGGVAGLSPTGPDEYLLFSQQFEARSGGLLNFRGESTTDPADPGDADQLTALDLNLFDAGLPVCPTTGPCEGSISFVNATTIRIDLNFDVLTPIIGPDEDTSGTVTIEELAQFKPGITGELTILAVGNPDHGQVEVAADKLSLTYTPDPDYAGHDQFPVTVTDGQNSVAGTVLVSVVEINDDPTAVNDTFLDADGQLYIIPEDNPNNFLPVLNNDFSDPDDPTAENLSVDTVQEVSANGGTVQRGSSGQGILYTPPLNFIGTDTFTYTTRDNRGGVSQAATVTVDVREQNDPPTASNDVFPLDGDSIFEGSQDVLLDVLANDSDAPDVGETIRIVEVTQPASGSVEIVGDGTMISYTPVQDFFGEAVFTYTIDDRPDGTGARATATVLVNVTGTNDPPTANDDSGPSFVVVRDTEDNPLDVLANDISLPDAPEVLTVLTVSGVTAGARVDIVNGEVQYTPPAGFVGTDTFTYTNQDPDGATDTATVTVDVVDFNPGSLQGFVYVDANNNGVKDPGERALSDITIRLTGTGQFGTVDQTTTTDTNGEYRFPGLAPGDYVIEETQPPVDQDNDGVPLLDGRDTVGSQGGSSLINDTFTITLAEGVDGENNNFGELKGLDVGGAVFHPAIFRERLPAIGIGGLDVSLYAQTADGVDADLLQSAETTFDGRFMFNGIAPANYRLELEHADFLLNNITSQTTLLDTAASTENDFLQIGREAANLSYRDFIARSPVAVHAAAAPGEASQRWYALGGWDDVTFFQATLGPDGSAVTIQLTDEGGTTFTGEIPVTDPRVRIPAKLGDGTSLVRLDGTRSSFEDVLTAQTNGDGGEAEAPVPADVVPPAGEGEAVAATLSATETFQPPIVIQPVLEKQPIPALITNPVASSTAAASLVTSLPVADTVEPLTASPLTPPVSLTTMDVGVLEESAALDQRDDEQHAAAVDAVLAEPLVIHAGQDLGSDDDSLEDDELEDLAKDTAGEDLLEAVDLVFASDEGLLG